MAASSLLAEIRASKKPYYVYILSKPDGMPFYVGLGRGRRVLRHEWAAQKTTKNLHRLNIIRQILSTGGEVGKAIDSWHDDLRGASDREIELIAEIGRLDLQTGPLVNQTSGGNFTWKIGLAGRKAAAKLTREQFKNPARRKKQRLAVSAYFKDPEARQKASEIATAAMTPGVRQKIGESRRRFNQENPLLAAANDAARRAALNKPEIRQKQSDIARKRMAERPELQAAMTAAALKPEAKARHAAAQRRRFSKPEERAKAAWAAAKWKAERTDLITRCKSLLQSLGLQLPSGHASIQTWRDFESRLLELSKENDNENA